MDASLSEAYKFLSSLTDEDIQKFLNVVESKVVADRVQETVYTLGTADVELTGEGTDQGYIPFANVLNDGDTCSYVIEGVKRTLQCNGQFEIGIGQWNAYANRLVRKQVLYSNSRDPVSGTYNKINFVADREPYNGYHKVWISWSAADVQSWQQVIRAFAEDILYVRECLENIEEARKGALADIEEDRSNAIDNINQTTYGVDSDGNIRTEYEPGQTDPCIMTDIVTTGNAYTALIITSGDDALDTIEDARIAAVNGLKDQYEGYKEDLADYKQQIDDAKDSALSDIETARSTGVTQIRNETNTGLKSIQDKYNTASSNIESEGTTQVDTIKSTGNTWNNTVKSTGTTWNNTVKTSGQLALDRINTKAYGTDGNGNIYDNYTEGTNIEGVIYEIVQAGKTQKDAVDKAGSDWNQTIINTGTTWNNTVKSTGESAVSDITSEGTKQVTNVTNEGTKQVGLVNSAGTTNINNINKAGTTNITNITNEGTKQVGNVTAEGEKQVAAVKAAGDEITGDLVGQVTSKLAKVATTGSYNDLLDKPTIVIKSDVDFVELFDSIYTGQPAQYQSKSVNPKRDAQTVTPDEGYAGLSAVNIGGITYTSTENTAGGNTVSIGTGD